MKLFRSLAALWLAAIPVSAQVPDLYDPDVVRDVRLQFAQPDWWNQLIANYAPEVNIAATMTVDGLAYPSVGVRFRGNTSYTQLPPGSEKKSFNIETDWLVAGQDLYGYSHLNLNNGFHDPTFLREFLSYMVMRRHGVAPKCNFVRLWLNGVYWGVYVSVEQPNKDMMKDWFRSNDGNRYRCFPTSGTFANGRCCFTWLGSTVSLYLAAYQAKQGDGTDLMQMCNTLVNTPTASLQATLPPIFSVDAFYRYAAVMNVLTNTDSYLSSGKDHFLYHDEAHGDFTTFPFDLNEAMAGSTSLDPWYNTTLVSRPAFSRTFLIPEWRQRYKAHVRTVVEQSVNPTWLTPLAQRYHAMIAADVAADPKKLYTTAQFTTNLTASVTISAGMTATLPGLVPFIQARSQFLLSHPDFSPPRATLSNLAHAPAQPNPTQAIGFTVTASALASSVRLFWRAVGPFQPLAMADDGLHGDGAANDGVWGASLPGQSPGTRLDYYVEAATSTGLATYLPFTAELEVSARHVDIAWPITPSPVRINEFVAQNVNGIVDENLQHEDWVELYNDSAVPVAAGNLWLSDDLTQLKYRIPAGTTIPPFGTILIWCDEDGLQGPLHANFKLAAGGETVALFAADGLSLHDAFAFGLQLTDVATGRALDGHSPWVTFTAPTPNGRNELLACGTRAFGAQVAMTHGVALSLSAPPRIGTVPSLDAAGGPAGGLAAFALALGPDHVDLGPLGVQDETLLLQPASLAVVAVLPLSGTGSGGVPLPIPANAGFVGLRLWAQALTATASVFDSSNGLSFVICP